MCPYESRGLQKKTIRLLSAKIANSRNFSGIERSCFNSLPRICWNTFWADLGHFACVTGPDLFALSRLLYRSSRPMWWAPHPNVCSKAPFRHSLPMVVVPCTTSVGGHIFMTACMRSMVPQTPPIKGAVLAQSVSQSLWLLSQPHRKVPSCDFPRAYTICVAPTQTTRYTVVWVHLFRNVHL